MTSKIYLCYIEGGDKENKIAFKHEIQAKEWVNKTNKTLETVLREADYEEIELVS